ncbi:FAD/NAD(P)-binding domain-containing protein [Westerdykella ornata]|uniref:FAD/NAD(P)-binding domain-containing protein n=1 Tax=Westerdykella ornata TaxID=318751 RepID=A0A6A6JNF8_WESOR|nr:FAD/NAD(P)-binding domain-containing protein [Westerdykella ornata]KAF2278057.1 FAD/NAD(P)-binding domain-containing protein [Westerdykella ornata]
MNGHVTDTGASAQNQYDIIATYAILEGRSNVGGTWDLFKYPGIRSDSDLHTFGFPFNPWKKPNPIATADSIVAYIKSTAAKFGIDRHIQFNRKVQSAQWSSDAQHWRLEVDSNGTRKTYYAKFLFMGTGYYDYEKPLQVDIPGLERFKGTRVHPQFWPEDLDYQGKKMIIIGSGATAITMMPAVVESGVGSVTMLQRSPSYVMSLPQKKPGEKRWYDYFPSWIAAKLVRLQFIVLPWLFYHWCRKFPSAAARFIRKLAKRQLPKDIPIDPHFKPAYNPWDQRLCLCPDGDFFKSFRTGRATVVTDNIKTVTEDGIELNSGRKLDADIIVTATGLNLQLCGNIALAVDGKPVNIADRFMWRSAMLTGVPNLGLMIGYVNASWTLGSDSAARLLTRLYKHMQDHGYTSATPEISPEEMKDPQMPLQLKSTYIQNGARKMPHAGRRGPWLPRDNYMRDNWTANYADLRDGMVFKSLST